MLIFHIRRAVNAILAGAVTLFLSHLFRLARYLWRFGFAMYLAIIFFFIGLQHAFPESILDFSSLFVSVIAVIAVMTDWLIRFCFIHRLKKTATPGV